MNKSLRITNGENEQEYYDLDFNINSTFFDLKQEIIRLYGPQLGITEPSQLELFIKNAYPNGDSWPCRDGDQVKDAFLTEPGSKNVYHFSINRKTDSSISSPLGARSARLDPWDTDNTLGTENVPVAVPPKSLERTLQRLGSWDLDTDSELGKNSHRDNLRYPPKSSAMLSNLLGPRDESEFLLLANSTLDNIPVLGVARNSDEAGIIDTDLNIHCGFIGLPKQDGSIDLYILWTTDNFDPAQFMYRYTKFYLDYFESPFIVTVDTPARGKIGMDHSSFRHKDHLVTTMFGKPYAKPDLESFIDRLLKYDSVDSVHGSDDSLSDYVLLDYKSNNGECVGTHYDCGIVTKPNKYGNERRTFFRGKMTSSDTTSSTFMFNNKLGEHCTPCHEDEEDVCEAELQECRSVGNEMIENMYFSDPELVKRNLRRYELKWLKKTPPELKGILESSCKKMTFTKSQLEFARCPTVIKVPEGQTLGDFIETPDMLRRQIGGIIYKKSKKQNKTKHNKTKHNKTKQNKKEHNKTKHNKTKKNKSR